MKKKNAKILKGIILFISLVLLWLGITAIIYNQNKTDDVTIRSNYEKREEKIELLKQIPNECIIEGEKIVFENIKNDKVKYNITNNNENIIINYYIQPDYYSSNENPYKAKITLTKDYKIVSKEVNIKSITFEEYKADCETVEKLMLVVFALEVLLGIAFITFMVFLIRKRAKG